MFRFDAKAVNLCAQYASKGDVRWYLEGIYAEPAPDGGAFLVATNGHQIAVFHDKTAICPEPVLFKLSSAGLSACKPLRGYHGSFVEINPVTERLTVFTVIVQDKPAEEIFLQPGKCLIEGTDKYPNWKKVFKPFLKGNAVETVSVNSLYLAHFFKATKPYCNRNYSGVSMFFKSSRDAILLRTSLIPELHVLIMPLRADEVSRCTVGFFKAIDKAEAA